MIDAMSSAEGIDRFHVDRDRVEEHGVRVGVSWGMTFKIDEAAFEEAAKR